MAKYRPYTLGTEAEGECELWEHACTTQGYPVKWYEGKTRIWNRVLFESHYECKIPPGYVICHKCGNKRCVNVDHMFLGTYRDNFEDARLKGRIRNAKGVDHGRAALTEKEVRLIRKMIAEGCSLRYIADTFYISASSVWRIKEFVTWRHLK
ncbi:MAG: HNH endonuclease [Candidatus Thorarchaeota archaeon]|jgi:hypothetical protein